MPKERRFIQCDSEKCLKSGEPGVVRRIAHLQMLFGSACGDSGYYDEIHSCDKCGAMYIRQGNTPANMGSGPDYFSDFSPFRGKATREELIVFAGALSGSYVDYKDERILATRDKRSEILYRLAGTTKQRLSEICKSAVVEVIYEKKPSKNLACCALALAGKPVIAWFDPTRDNLRIADEVFIHEEAVKIERYGVSNVICYFAVSKK